MTNHVKELVCLEYLAQTTADNPSHAQIAGLKIVQCDHFIGFDIEQTREVVRRYNSFSDLLAACEFAVNPSAPFKVDKLEFANSIIKAIVEKAESAIAKAKKE